MDSLNKQKSKTIGSLDCKITCVLYFQLSKFQKQNNNSSKKSIPVKKLRYDFIFTR